MEIWKDISGFEGAYQISDLGNVRSLDRWVTVKSKLGKERKLFVKGKRLAVIHKKDGYKYTKMKHNKKQYSVATHRLLAAAFICADIKGKDVDHIDGDRKNNSLNNLRVCKRNNNLTFKNVKRDRKSPYVGVKVGKPTKKYGMRYSAQIWNPSTKKCVTVCGFSTPEAAKEEYRRLRIELYGDDISIQE